MFAFWTSYCRRKSLAAQATWTVAKRVAPVVCAPSQASLEIACPPPAVACIPSQGQNARWVRRCHGRRCRVQTEAKRVPCHIMISARSVRSPRVVRFPELLRIQHSRPGADSIMTCIVVAELCSGHHLGLSIYCVECPLRKFCISALCHCSVAQNGFL